ncbi:MAG: lactate racemase domain-containing protein [Candidatus Dadabacteria bacterium]|nr:lactate racemase domain-containing protein [Candidatus Dadabacteria bacterium]
MIISRIAYGDEFIPATLPDRTHVIEAPSPISPLENPEQAIRDALYSPIAHDPISKLVGPNSRVTIAFDDPVIPQVPMKKPDFREMAIIVLLGELEKAGVKRSNIKLICANALHRKFTNGELSTILGSKLTLAFGPSHLYCHDAEDRENLVTAGETERGFEVEVNKAVMESDQVFYINITSLPFHGGWKSIAVGLSSYRSIRQHHRPFRGASGKSVMDARRSSFQKLIWEMGAVVEKELARYGRRIFTIESVLNTQEPQELIAVFAGNIPDVHEKILDVLYKQQVVHLPRQTDVAIYGIPNQSYYANLSKINPILVRNQSLSYAFGLYHNKPLIREGGIAIFVNPCFAEFNEMNHPSYVEFFNRILPDTQDPYDIWDFYAEDFAHRPEYVHKYRYAYGFHGVHPLILWGQGAFPLRHLSRVFLAGAKDFEAAKRIGFEPFKTLDEAITEAESSLGRDCTITYHNSPPSFITSIEM